MKKLNLKRPFLRGLLVLSVVVISSCAGKPNNIDCYDETIKSLECWDEVRWNQCEIERSMYKLFDKRRWQKCREWSCDK